MPGSPDQFKIQKADLQPVEGKLAEQSGEQNKEKDAKNRTDQLVQEAGRSVDKVGAQLKDLPTEVATQFRTDVAEYFTASVETFDSNGVEGLSLQEFNAFKQKMLAKLTENLSTFQEQKADAEAQKKEGDDKKKSETEKKLKTLSEARSELKGSAINLQELGDLNEAALNNPQELQVALQNHQARFAKMQEVQKQFAEFTANTTGMHEAATKEMQEAADKNSIVMGGGAAVGAAVGALFGGIGAVPGAIIGGYAAKFMHNDAEEAKQKQLAAELNQELAAAKTLFKGKQTEYAAKAADFRSDGAKLNTGTEAVKAAVASKGAVEMTSVEKAAQETADALANHEQQTQQVDDAQKQIEKQRDELAKRKQSEGADTKELQRAEAALDGKTAELTDAQASIEGSAQELQERQATLSTAQTEIQGSISQQQMTLEEMEVSIADTVFDANVETTGGLLEIGKQSEALEKLPAIEAKETDMNPLSVVSRSFEGIGKAVHVVFNDTIVAGLDYVSKNLKEWAKDKPPLDLVMAAAMFPLDTTSGLVAGAGEMVEGIATMIAHPVDTAKGLGALVGLNENISAADAWKEMGKAMIAFDDFEKGDFGKASGKILFNILTTVTGAGAAGQGAKGAALAYKIARAGGSGALKASMKAVATGGRMAVSELASGTIKNIAELPGNVLKSTGKILRAPMEIAKSARLGKVGRLDARVASMSDDLAKAGAKTSEFLAAERLPTELLGKSAEELGKLTGPELLALGIADGKSIQSLVRYRGLVSHAESAQKALLAVRAKAFTRGMRAAKLDDAVPGTGAAAKLSGAELSSFVDDFNRNNFIANDKFDSVLQTTKDGMLVVDGAGQLKLLDDPADISRFIESSAKSRGGDAMALRLDAAESLLGKPLTDVQKMAVMRAHELPGTIGALKDGQMTAKARALLETMPAEDAKKLMDSGICGDAESVLDDVGKKTPSETDTVIMSAESEAVDNLPTKDQYMAAKEKFEKIEKKMRRKNRLPEEVTADEFRFKRAKEEYDTLRDGYEKRLQAEVKAENAKNVAKDASGTAADISEVSEVAAEAEAIMAEATPSNPIEAVRASLKRFQTETDAAKFTPEFRAKFDDWRNGKGDIRGADIAMESTKNPAVAGDLAELKQYGTKLRDARMEYALTTLDMKPGQRYALRGEPGWMLKEFDKAGNLIFEKNGKTMRIAPEKQLGAPQRLKAAPKAALDSSLAENAAKRASAQAELKPLIEEMNALRARGEALSPTETARLDELTGKRFEIVDKLFALDDERKSLNIERSKFDGPPAAPAELRLRDLANPKVLKQVWQDRAAVYQEMNQVILDGMLNVRARAKRAGARMKQGFGDAREAIRSFFKKEPKQTFKQELASDPYLQSMKEEILKLEDTPEGLDQRRYFAKIILKQNIDDTKWTAIKEAHDIKMYEGRTAYSKFQLRDKMDILTRAGFKSDEVEKILRMGIAGNAPDAARVGPSLAAKAKQWEMLEAAMNRAKGLRGTAGDSAAEAFINAYDEGIQVLKKTGEIPEDWQPWYEATLTKGSTDGLATRDIAAIDSRVLKHEIESLEHAIADKRLVAERTGSKGQISEYGFDESQMRDLKNHVDVLKKEFKKRNTREYLGKNPPASYEKALTARESGQMVSDARAKIDAIRASGMPDDLEKAAKMEKQVAYVEGILSGDMKLVRGPKGIELKNYEGLRDLKGLGLNIQEQKLLAKKLFENSGVKMEEVINVSNTLPDEWLKNSLGKIIPDGDTKILGMDRDFDVAGLQEMCKGPDPIGNLNRVIGYMPDGPEKALLKNLADDMADLKNVPLDDAEKALILCESMEYMQDYQRAILNGDAFGGKTMTAQELFGLLRENQHKLAHQTMFDRKYFTGSDHGVLHVLEADMRWGAQIAEELIGQGKMTHEQKVLLRQATVDHDMGYAFNPLDTIDKAGGSYFAATKDHPLFSALLFEENFEKYAAMFGRENAEALKGIVLDHSDAMNKAGLGAQGSELIASILAQADCMGVSADYKMMKLFKEPEMMAGLQRAFDLGPALKQAKGTPGYGAIEQQALAIKSNMTEMVKRAYGGTPFEESYLKAIDRFFDPKSADFAAKRDLGSHSIGYKGIQVENGVLTASFETNPVFDLLATEGQADVACKAIAKAVEDFGYKVPDAEIADMAKDLLDGKPVTFEGGKVHFRFERGADAPADVLALQRTLSREVSLRQTIEALQSNNRDLFQKALGRLRDSDGITEISQPFTMATETGPRLLQTPGDLIEEAAVLSKNGDDASRAQAQQMLEHLRAYGRGQLTAVRNAS